MKKIHLLGTPDEIEGRKMNTIPTVEPVLNERVANFIQQHHAQRELQTVCELARQCFPELMGLEVRLQEDVDEVGRLRVVLHVILPETHSLDILLQQTRQYHTQFVEKVSLSRCPLFALLTHFGAE